MSATCVATCGQCERFQQHSRTQVEQQVANVNGSIEIHGEQQVEQLVWQHVWQHVASVKALLGTSSVDSSDDIVLFSGRQVGGGESDRSACEEG